MTATHAVGSAAWKWEANVYTRPGTPNADFTDYSSYIVIHNSSTMFRRGHDSSYSQSFPPTAINTKQKKQRLNQDGVSHITNLAK